MRSLINSNSYLTYRVLWGVGLAFAFFTATTIQSKDKFAELFAVDLVHFFLSISLGVLAFGLFIIYSAATITELDLLNLYLDEHKSPRVKTKTYFTIIFLSIFFGALISVSINVMLFSIILVVFNFFDIWGGWQVSRTIQPLIKSKLESEKNPENRKIIEAIRSFYFNNPTLPRVVTIMFFNWVSVCLGIIYFFTGDMVYRNIIYLIIITNIIVGEIIIFRWRVRRDSIIEPAEVELKKQKKAKEDQSEKP